MAIPAHMRLTFGGQLGASLANATETWSCNLSYQDSPSLSAALQFQGPSGAIMTSVKDAAAAFIADSRMNFGQCVWLTFVKLNEIAAGGHYASETSNTYYYPTAPRGPASSNPAFECSMVVSLQGAGRAPGSRGRIYLPPQGYSVNQGGDVGDTIAGNYAAGAKSFLDAIASWPSLDPGAGPKLVVASKAGTLTPVTQVRVGTVPDTQRRRRAQLKESYNALSLA